MPSTDVPSTRVIDLDGQTLRAGLINLQVHFQLDASGDTWGRLQAEDDQLLSLHGVKIADVIAVRGDLLTDLSTMRNVTLVINGGQVVMGDAS